MSKMSKSPQIEFKGFLSFLILHELSREPLYGEQLAQRIGKRKGGSLTPGTIYPALKQLRTLKLLKFSQEGRKKIYTLTEKGGKELQKHYALFGRYFKGLRAKIPKERAKRRKNLKGRATPHPILK